MAISLRLLSFITGMVTFTPLYGQVSYKVAPGSIIQISGTSTLSDWVVKSEQISGEMSFIASPKKVKGNEMQTGTIKDAKAILEVSTLKSEKGETMDNKMYNALKNDTHPQITFVLTGPVEIQKAPAKISAVGNVQIAAVTRPLIFDLNVSYADDKFHIEGSRSLKLSDFEIQPPTAMFGQIETGDEIVVKLNLHLLRK
ncbi:MAG: YceI family protein [Cyclobacteriaceae bacterium]